MPKLPPEVSLRPYVALSAGPYFATVAGNQTGTAGIYQGVRTQGVVGGYVGGGIDYQLSRRFMLGGEAGYHALANFSEEIKGRRNYSGPNVSFSLSFLWGGR